MSTEPGYPVLLRLAGRRCVVAGGGAVAVRKVAGLLAAGAEVTVIAPQIAPELHARAGVICLERPVAESDAAGAFLVVAATSDSAVNTAFSRAARRAGALVNCADPAEESDFTLPAVLRRGTLTVAVASDGTSPALAAALRDLLAGQIGPEYADLCRIAAALRQKRLTDPKTNAYNHAVLSRLAAGLPPLLAAGDFAAVERYLQQVTGTDITLAGLGLLFEKGTT